MPDSSTAPVSRRTRLLATRVLGVGLAAALAAVTVALAVTGRLGLYINPESSWFAVSMAVLALVGAVTSFALPLGAEADHGHDHAHDHPHDHGDAHDHGTPAPRRPTAVLGSVLVGVGGAVALGTVAVIVLTPPASLSAEIAMSRDTGSAPLFQGADTVALAATGDTASFGIGEWASVFATATNPEAFDGDQVTLTGFATPGGDGFQLTRLVITHCVIDAQPAFVPVTGSDAPDTGEWVTVTGTVRDVDGTLQVQAAEVSTVDEPSDPYEY
ncbi:TIGR03943 family putative permease subunit [Microbacterium telephonicum]|uniref:Putative repeat protein (TIGR03943 family) n=1 Tax=Microbacterium telephonicum TaxID=1714841 RepID=A0A498CFE3_9MICO|nr:TIGR03943 family protein [Microbacterium telephonicum]RLK52100.1 putative repeat protein (TIGR03943 family) [Microbacterium telephonicum]